MPIVLGHVSKKEYASEMHDNARALGKELDEFDYKHKRHEDKLPAFPTRNIGFEKLRGELERIGSSPDDFLPKPISDNTITMIQQAMADTRAFAFGKETVEKGSGLLYFEMADELESITGNSIHHSNLFEHMMTTALKQKTGEFKIFR